MMRAAASVIIDISDFSSVAVSQNPWLTVYPSFLCPSISLSPTLKPSYLGQAIKWTEFRD